MALKPAKELVVDLINHDNQKLYTVDMFMFGPVVELPEGHSSLREISVLLSPTLRSKMRGQRKVYYNRLELDEIFGDNKLLSYEYHYLTAENALQAINESYDVNLTFDDIFIEEYADGDLAQAPNQLTLMCHDESYAFKGDFVFYIVNFIFPLSQIITTPSLDGLEYPPDE